MADARFEIVHFVEGFSDGVLNGTADYQGSPHHFVLRSAEPNALEVYELTPLSPDVFSAVTEAWEIWRRWERSVGPETTLAAMAVPALPEDRQRQAELRDLITSWLAAAQTTAFLAEGDFEQVLGNGKHGAPSAALQVKWKRLD